MKKTMLIVLALLGLMVQGMSAQTRSRIVEEGGTGAYKAVMKEVATLPAHTVFVPQDLTASVCTPRPHGVQSETPTSRIGMGQRCL